MDIILATWNKTKLKWLTEGFLPLGMNIRPVNSDEIKDVEETGLTSVENALLKVRAIGTKPNAIIIGEDSILSVDALEGFPGVKTVRWAPGTDDDRASGLLKKLKSVPIEKRTAKFQSAIAVLYPDGKEETFVGELKGSISEQLVGEIGTGYLRIFLPPDGYMVGKSGSSKIEKGDHRDQAIKKAIMNIKLWKERKI
ncbi:MAG: non-canonical purine NTP pyrophosphatase [Rhodothermaceae bacterium]